MFADSAEQRVLAPSAQAEQDLNRAFWTSEPLVLCGLSRNNRAGHTNLPDPAIFGCSRNGTVVGFSEDSSRYVSVEVPIGDRLELSVPT